MAVGDDLIQQAVEDQQGTGQLRGEQTDGELLELFGQTIAYFGVQPTILDAQPMCADCWNKPFCGISPVSTYVRDGDLFGQRPRSFECKEHMAVAGTLFALLADEADRETTGILERWAGEGARYPSASLSASDSCGG